MKTRTVRLSDYLNQYCYMLDLKTYGYMTASERKTADELGAVAYLPENGENVWIIIDRVAGYVYGEIRD